MCLVNVLLCYCVSFLDCMCIVGSGESRIDEGNDDDVQTRYGDSLQLYDRLEL